jgi:Helix-turn-helix domain
LRNWIDDGKLPAVRIGRRVRVRRVDLDRVLAQGATVEIEPKASRSPPPKPSSSSPRRWSALAGCATA